MEPVLGPKMEPKSHEKPIRRGSRNGSRFGTVLGGCWRTCLVGLTECAEVPGETIEGVSRAGREVEKDREMDVVDPRKEKSGTPSPRVAGGVNRFAHSAGP